MHDPGFQANPFVGTATGGRIRQFTWPQKAGLVGKGVSGLPRVTGSLPIMIGQIDVEWADDNSVSVKGWQQCFRQRIMTPFLTAFP